NPGNAIVGPSSSWSGPARPRAKRWTPRCSKHPGRHKGANGDIIVAMKRAKPVGKPLRGLSGRLVLLGAGKMGSAMLEGWLTRGLDPRRLIVLEPHPTKAIRALARRGVTINPRKRISEASALVHAVKPQNAPSALPSAAPFVGKSTLALSIMAGKTIAFLEEALPEGTAVVRAMPNTPAAIGRSITVACANPMVSARQRKLASNLLSAIG